MKYILLLLLFSQGVKAQTIEYYYSKKHSDSTINHVLQSGTDSLYLMFVNDKQFTFSYDPESFLKYFVVRGVFDYKNVLYNIDTINMSDLYKKEWGDVMLVDTVMSGAEVIRFKKLKLTKK